MNTNKKNAVVIFSGGMDSTTLLYDLLDKCNKVNAISFNYGQKHNKELDQAATICKSLGVEHNVVDISSVKGLLQSALTTDEKVPEGHYAEDTMKKTVVPNRNAIMLSIAYGYAVSLGYDIVAFGAHAGDHFVYPDCRPEFSKALNEALNLGNKGFGEVQIVSPFIDITKADIVSIGLKLNVPYEFTWSCYNGLDRPCLKCGTCTERTEAFYLNDVQDPSLTDEEWETAVKEFKLVENE